MSDFLCVGDHICLYCEETEGFIYNSQSSGAHNSLYVYQWQDREKPPNIPNPQAVQFQICIQNRYKLNKKFRKMAPPPKEDTIQESLEQRTFREQAKQAAEAENDDNIAEQRRQHGKRVRYGEVLQLLHVFTNKYIHVSTTQTSRRDKNNMLIHMQTYNAKHAQFKILPRYKVKSEGEFVQIFDQIIFESVKSPGQFYHASSAWKIDHFNLGSELNLGIQPAGFTVIKSSRQNEDQRHLLKGGSVIRLFHKELEAYLVAEGLFDDEITEDVHLRIRLVDQLIPKSLYPSTSGNTYWQIEAEASVLNGEIIRWEQQVRFRHMTTRQYLCITADRRVTLTPDCRDPRTVFRLHPVIKEADEVQFDSYARIEHVITGYWLHALRDEEYVRRGFRDGDEEHGASMQGLKWDGADLRKISASGEKMYHDAYTLQRVEAKHLHNFNFVAGMVPFLLNLILDRGEGKILNAKKAHKLCQALEEVRDFMKVNGVAEKERQKLMRNLRVIDLLVKVLQFQLEGAIDVTHLTKVFKAAYDALYTYMVGNSRKNALYFAKYIDFFNTQITVTIGDIGLNVAQMIVELIRDNRKIVDRITQEQIEMFVGLLKQNKNYRYLDLLNVLCVCDGVAIADNQTYITEHWLRRDKENRARYLTERGQNVNGQPNIIYLSTDNACTWLPLHEFVDKENNLAYCDEEVKFFEHQLDLFGRLSHGRNDFAIFVITRELGILTWDEAFLSLRSTLLLDQLRAKYCSLIIGLFIDVGTNYSVLDHTNLSFIYEDVLAPGPNADGEFVKKLPRLDNWIAQDGIIKDLVTLFPVIRDWITEFLDENKDMTHSEIGKNMLIEQVLRLFHFLVKFGYYSSEDIKLLLKPLLNLLNGKNDKPFPSDNEKGGYTKDSMKLVLHYRNKERYEKSPGTAAIVNAKFQCMAVMDLLLTFQFNTRIESFIAKFKTADLSVGPKAKFKSILAPLLSDDFDPFDPSKSGLGLQKRALKELKTMFDVTAYFDSEQITNILMDLSNYKYDKMINKSLSLLNKFFSSKTKLFKMAVQAMVLITTDSCQCHREIARTMPILRRYAKAKLNDDQVKTMGAVIDTFKGFCQLAKDENERHPMNQNILINHEVLSLVFDILSQEIDPRLIDQYRGLEEILKKSLQLLKSLARGNDVVQTRMFERLDTLLTIKVVEPELAIALKEMFIGNQTTCLKILPSQIQTIVDLAAHHQEKAPQFLDLLNCIVKVEGLGLTLKRNQAYVMKYIMQDYNKIAYVLDQPRDARETILKGEQGKAHLAYLINLIDLLATCAEGENRFIESMCQTILTVDELLWVINHHEIDNNLKKPFLGYFLWVYMKTAGSAVESGAGDLPHDGSLWKFLQQVTKDAFELTTYVSRNQETTSNLMMKGPEKTDVADKTSIESVVHVHLHYVFDAVMPLLQAFYTKFYVPEKELYPQEVENTDKLARALVGLCESVIPLVHSPTHLKTLIACITAVIPASTVPSSAMEGLIEGIRNSNLQRESRQQQAKGQREYYSGELELNQKLRTFAVNCSLLYGGHNTVQAQLKYKSKRAYTEIGGDEELPLGEEFQLHLQRFLKPHEKKVVKRIELLRKLVDQLSISAGMYRKLQTEAERMEQEELDIRCLQLIRAVIHNEERKLPEDWEEDPQEHRKQIALIRELQIEMNEMGGVVKSLPHLARPADRIAKEVLAFVCLMLFNANEEVQGSLLNYFLLSREENFFAAIRNRMHMSALAIKERRSLAAQARARAKEVMAQTKSMQTSMSIGKKALQEYDGKKKKRRISLATLQSKATRRREAAKKDAIEEAAAKATKAKKPPRQAKVNGVMSEKMKDKQRLLDKEKEAIEMDEVKAEGDNQENDQKAMIAAMKEEDMGDDLDQKDDGYIELVLRVLARMCDGQHMGLQDYLREQPDNMKSFNIVAETAQFLNLVYSNITAQNIQLVVQLFETLNEFAVGNQHNRSVMLNSKVVDYVNFILRSGEFKSCTPEVILDLKQCIGNLLLSMIEESSPESLAVAKEIKDTLDKEAVYKVMGTCYETQQNDDARKLSSEMKESLDSVGFTYFLVLARIHDIDPRLAHSDDIHVTPVQKEAYNHYKKNTMSIEIIKDDHLQKINFRVKSKNVLREEIKEKMIWNVDRSSPSSKIRDLMLWSRDILKDIYYQRKILSNPIATFLTKNWLMWNKMVVVLSVAINVIMLVTWDAQASFTDMQLAKNTTSLPKAIRNPMPNITHLSQDNYELILYGLGGAHNLFSFLVLLTYFLSNHPSLPSVTGLFTSIKETFQRDEQSKEKDDDEDEEESKLEIKLISVTTFYYLLFMALSVMGTLFQGYFFAFHLLNIVNNNQLLKGVIQAVTQNGRSLLWVAVLGFVLFYLYALISFAFLRASFDPDDDMYCSSLWQCTVTVIRYGLIGDIFENLVIHRAENTFAKFGAMVIFHLSFFIFITTIGLNIIFGIIVDTFSELRDLKWTAERDMRDTCFICSRNSYDFEHHGNGFEQHIEVEHNVWSYIFFFIHLHDTKHSDYTSLEYYVHKLLRDEKYDFFPLNRALSLSAMDEDSTESKVDDLLRFVVMLVERTKEEDARKKREEERIKQVRWREEHTNALMEGDEEGSVHSGTSSHHGDDDDDEGPPPPSGGTQGMRQKRWMDGYRGSRGSQQGTDHMTTDTVQYIPGKSAASSQEDFLHGLSGPDGLDDYSLMPGHASPIPPKTPPRSSRSPPPRPHSGHGSRFPSVTTPGVVETNLDMPPPMSGDAVHLIDFDAIAREELSPHQSPTPPQRYSPPPLTRQASHVSSRATTPPSHEPAGHQLRRSRSRLGTQPSMTSLQAPSPDQHEAYPGPRSSVPRDRRLTAQPSTQDPHYGSRGTLHSQEPHYGSRGALSRLTPQPSVQSVQAPDQDYRGSRASVPRQESRLSPHPSVQSIHAPSPDVHDAYRSLPGARSVPGMTPPGAVHAPTDAEEYGLMSPRGSMPPQYSRRSSRVSPHEASPVETILPRPPSVQSVQSIPPPPSKTGSMTHIADVMSSSGSSRHSDVTRLATDTEGELGSDLHAAEQLPPPPSVVRPPSDIDDIDMDQPDDDDDAFLADATHEDGDVTSLGGDGRSSRM